MDLTAFGPLVGSLLQAGSPMISTALQMGIGEIPIVGGIAGPLVGMAAPNIVSLIAQKLGAPPTATPEQIAAKIRADPSGAKAALASLEEQHSFDLATQKQADATLIASQAQQVQLNVIDAQSESRFARCARPAMLWGFGALVLVAFALPFAVWALLCFGIKLPAPPPVDPQAIAILSGLLAVTVAARSYDKRTAVPVAPAVLTVRKAR